jgi:hypothetical protein
MFQKINQLNNLLEEITGNEVVIEIVKGNLLITITENKRGIFIPDDVKLPDMDDDLRDLYEFTQKLPQDV